MIRRNLLAAALAVGLLSWFTIKQTLALEYTGQEGRDPFVSRPTGVPSLSDPIQYNTTPAQPPFTLNGIIWVPEKPRALINGKRVTVGAEIDGAKVTAIGRKEVKIDFNGSQIVLNLEKGGSQ